MDISVYIVPGGLRHGICCVTIVAGEVTDTLCIVTAILSWLSGEGTRVSYISPVAYYCGTEHLHHP